MAGEEIPKPFFFAVESRGKMQRQDRRSRGMPHGLNASLFEMKRGDVTYFPPGVPCITASITPFWEYRETKTLQFTGGTGEDMF